MDKPVNDPPIGLDDLQYPERVGRLFANLSFFEFNLRVTLYFMDNSREGRRSTNWKIADLKIGERVEESWITSRDYLSHLIAAYNERQSKLGLQLIDTEIGDIRNAMSHGIISSAEPTSERICVKFSPPRKGFVTVEAKYKLTPEWINHQNERVLVAGKAVNKRLHEVMGAN